MKVEKYICTRKIGGAFWYKRETFEHERHNFVREKSELSTMHLLPVGHFNTTSYLAILT